MSVQPTFSRLLAILNNSRIAQANPALYDYLKQLLDSNSQSQKALNTDLKGLEDLIKSIAEQIEDFTDLSIITELDETDEFPNSRILKAGTNITLDPSVDGELKINSAGGSGGTSYITETREIPIGLINGTNTIFTLANIPVGSSEQVFLNGLLQDTRGIDYSISGAVITFLIPPLSGDRILVTYQRI